MNEDDKKNEHNENENLNNPNDNLENQNQEEKQTSNDQNSIQEQSIDDSYKNKKKKGGGFFKFLLFLFGIAIVGGLGYVGYHYFKDSFEDLSNPKITIIDSDGKDAKRFNTKLINSSENESLLVANKEYKFGNLSVIEYPVARDQEGNLIYFLNEEGIQRLNELFKKRVNFGPELNSLNTIYINKQIPFANVSNANGVYLPSEFSIYLFIDSIVKKDGTFTKWPVEQKVEMLLSVLAHEYTHHIDNVYNKSTKRSDPNANTDLVYKIGDEKRRELVTNIEANNNKFLTEFRTNLGYTENQNFVRNRRDFHISNGTPIFREFSSYDLFKFSNLNYDSNLKDRIRFKTLGRIESNYFFNNNDSNRVFFGKKTDPDKIRYLYSFEELVPRELLKLSYTANPKLYKNSNSYLNYLYFSGFGSRGFNSDVYLTAIGDDILKTIGFDATGENQSNFKIFSNNWVFDPELKKYYTKDEEYPYINIAGENSRAKGLFKAYLDLMGYRQAISYIGSDTSKWTEDRKDYNNINFGGYLKINKNFLNNSIPNHKFSFVINSANKDPLKIKLNPTQYNFIAKKYWNQTYTEGKINNYTEKTIYPENQSNYEYVAYYSDSVGINEINKYIEKDGKLNIKIWIDQNDDNEIDDNEISDILDKNNANDNYQIWKQNARTITNYRQYMAIFNERNALSKTYQIAIKKDEDKNEFWYEWKKY
ncbi:hypothetical protein DA803_03055 [[Mycoplasma] phocae]|uniref:Uncharacterized protein n=1 Tax=[Mycoplasma] phocae TaxID=142651 RepID=A0A2Z5IR00_9BACT|nr:hypothetical protein [[Mycoplasma] phocae]AXE61047.1 hypothetical protein DA803_03055 [[Mycoplasma] phocae]